MKKILLAIALFGIGFMANAQVKTPAPSPTQTIKQEFGLSSIELSYSRPGMKGRKIFGDLVPYDKVWRTGANGATTLTFGDDVIIGGKTIPAGKYGLLSIPGKTSWTLIITKQTNVTSPSAYKPEEDVVRVTAKVNIVGMKAETFTMQFANLMPESCELNIRWDNVLIVLPIKTEIDSRIIASIDASMKSEKPTYAQAAAYYLETGRDINQAIEWYNKAVDGNPNAFWLKYQLARAYAKAGKKALAKEMAQKSMKQAEEAKNPDYVALNTKLLADLK